MMKTPSQYREKVFGIVIDEEHNFLIVQLLSYKENDWNFAGGGIEEGETHEETILRELSEELGTDKFKALKQSEIKQQYEWSNRTSERMLRESGTKYRGSMASYFLVKFTGNREDIKPDPGEIKNIKWVEYNELINHFNFPNQWNVAKRVIEELGLQTNSKI